MLHKSLRSLVLLTAVFGLCGCETLQNYIPDHFFTFADKPKQTQTAAAGASASSVRYPSSVVVCRSHQCAPSKLSMSATYIYNSLLQLFDNNNYQKILICQADPQTRTCLENYITLPIKVGVVPTNAYIDHAKITDVIVGKHNVMNIILNYNMTYGGQVADCTPAKSLLFAKTVNHVLLEDAGYNCKMTTVGMTNVKTVFAIDYIDLDYGYIGGHYSIGLSGPAFGGGNGYMLLRLPKNAYPLSPALKAPKGLQTNAANRAAGIEGNNSLSSANLNEVQVFPLPKQEDTVTAETTPDTATETPAE